MFHIHKKTVFFINQPLITVMSIFQEVKMPNCYFFFSKSSQEKTALPYTVNEHNGKTFYICSTCTDLFQDWYFNFYTRSIKIDCTLFTIFGIKPYHSSLNKDSIMLSIDIT